MASANILTNL